jgi:hypothetical protein
VLVELFQFGVFRSYLVEAVCQSGRGGLVHNTENIETSDSSSVLGGGTLSVVEVGGNGNNSVLDRLAEVALRYLLHLTQNHGGNLFGGEGLLLAVNLDANIGLTVLVDDLEGEVLDVILNGLVLVLLTDETFLLHSQYASFQIIVCGDVRTMSKMVRSGLEANWFLAASPTRRSSSVKATQEGVIRLPVEGTCQFGYMGWLSMKLTLVVGDDLDLSVLHDTDTGVGGSKINTDYGAGDSIAVIRDGLLVLGVCCLSQHQTADEDEEKVEGNGPC